jgi:hypothetical protein
MFTGSFILTFLHMSGIVLGIGLGVKLYEWSKRKGF